MWRSVISSSVAPLACSADESLTEAKSTGDSRLATLSELPDGDTIASRGALGGQIEIHRGGPIPGDR